MSTGNRDDNPKAKGSMTPDEMADFEKQVVQGEESVPAKGVAPQSEGPRRPMTADELATFEEHVVQSEDEPQGDTTPPAANKLPSPD